MNRREVLRSLGVGGGIILAGCTGLSENTPSSTVMPAETTPSTTSQEPPTKTAPPTRTPRPRPEISALNLISSYEQFGDVMENAIESVDFGDKAIIGFRFEALIREGIVDVEEVIEVIEEDIDSQTAIRRIQDRREIDEYSGRLRFEQTVEFDIGSWTRDEEFRVEVTVEDRESGLRSETVSVTFEVD